MGYHAALGALGMVQHIPLTITTWPWGQAGLKYCRVGVRVRVRVRVRFRVRVRVRVRPCARGVEVRDPVPKVAPPHSVRDAGVYKLRL